MSLATEDPQKIIPKKPKQARSKKLMLADYTALNLLDVSHGHPKIPKVCSSISLKLFSECWA